MTNSAEGIIAKAFIEEIRTGSGSLTDLHMPIGAVISCAHPVALEELTQRLRRLHRNVVAFGASRVTAWSIF